MAVSLKTLGIDRLGVEEIWDSIAADSMAVPLTPEQRKELELRLAAHEANPEDTVPWSEVRDSLSKLLDK
jgi:putative addiction module component (TIGR02574 family)